MRVTSRKRWRVFESSDMNSNAQPYSGQDWTGMLLLDKTDVRPRGETAVEPCDLLGLDGTLCHVKRHANATGTSHLAS